MFGVLYKIVNRKCGSDIEENFFILCTISLYIAGLCYKSCGSCSNERCSTIRTDISNPFGAEEEYPVVSPSVREICCFEMTSYT